MKKLFLILLFGSYGIFSAKAQTQGLYINGASIIINTNQLIFCTNILSSSQGFIFSQISANGGYPNNIFGGLVWHNNSQKALQGYLAGVTNALSGSLFTPTAAKTVTNVIVETSIFPTSGVGAVGLAKSFPANFWSAGKTAHIHVEGVMNSLDASNNSATFKWKFGGTTYSSAASSGVTSAVVDMFQMEMWITCYTTGVSGTFVVVSYVKGTGWAYSGVSLTSYNGLVADTTGALTFDMTITPDDTALAFRAQSGSIDIKN